MNFDLKTLGLAEAAAEKCDLLVLLVADGFSAGTDVLSTLVAQAIKSADLSTKAGQNLSLYQVPGVAARRVVLLGVGAGDARGVRQGVQAAASQLRAASVKRAVLCFAGPASAEAVTAAVQGVAQASYVYTTTKPKAEARTLNRVIIGVADTAATAQAFEHSVAVTVGVEFAREWGNRPANYATPTLLGEAAKELAQHTGIQCKVMGPAEVAKLGMGSFMAVAQGSKEPLRFIELRYTGAAKSQAPIVLGVFRALAELQPAVNVVGLIPACENLPDGRALKPGDVVTSMSGQTIEILNTDAEGRLVLCDALTYAARLKPAAVVDIATLTGACVIALGGVRSGLFATDEALAQALLAAGESAQDLCWRMPLDDDYAEGLKSNFADVANVAGRPAGSITAAKFLQRFVGEFPWAHLDIAGTAWKSGAAKGATGRPVGLLLHYLLQASAGAQAAVSPAKAVKAEKKSAAKPVAAKSVAAKPAAQKTAARKPSAKPAASGK